MVKKKINKPKRGYSKYSLLNTSISSGDEKINLIKTPVNIKNGINNSESNISLDIKKEDKEKVIEEKPKKFKNIFANDYFLFIISGFLLCSTFFIGHIFPFSNDKLTKLMVFCVTAVSVIIAMLTKTGKKLLFFLAKSKNELKNIEWPDRKETIKMTVAILCIVVFFATIIWVIDYIFMYLINFIIK